MEISRRTWSAAVRLAAVLSVIAAAVAVIASRIADVPQAAIVLPVIVVAFASSWIQTGRIRRNAMAERVIVPAR